MKLRLVSIDDQPEPPSEPRLTARPLGATDPGADGPLWSTVAAIADTLAQPLLVAAEGRVIAANEAMRRLANGNRLIGRAFAEIVDGTEPGPLAGVAGEDMAYALLRVAEGAPAVPARLQLVEPLGLGRRLTVAVAEGVDLLEPRHAALRDSEARFRAIVNTLPLPIAIARLDDDRLIFVNEQWCAMAGLEREDAIGRQVTDFYVEPEDRERLKGALLAQGAVRQFLTRHRFGSRTLWVELRAITMNFAGHPASLAVFQDVTDAKEHERLLVEAKEAAEAANRTKSEFLASMSHELRTPLNAILGFSDMIMLEAFGPAGNPRYVEYAKDIHESGTLLLRLINDVLDLAKMEAGKLSLVEELFDIADAVGAALRVTEPLASAGKIALGTEPAPTWFRLRGDQRRVTQVLINLLSNGVKFTPAGGRVTVSAGIGPGGAGIIGVSDTGIGISAEDLQRLTEPFVQLESTMTRRFRGSGLGLAIARSLTEMHGGRIAIDSEPGKGTTVRVAFPPERVLCVQ
jgi:PAS domain S-box-containing protein